MRDAETGQEFQIENEYVMSPKDLCTIAQLPRLLDAGVTVLKIEGRGRSADYVATTVRCYREAVECHLRGEEPSAAQLASWRTALGEVFNRRFWEGGYYLGVQADVWAGCRDSQATIRKEFLGVVLHYYGKPQVVEVLLQSGNLRPGTRILFTGHTTGAEEGVVSSLQQDGKPLEFAGLGQAVTFPFRHKLRPGDKLFALWERR